MTHIIDLQAIRDARPIGARLPSGGAEILFFLGVRYERLPDAVPMTPEPADRTPRPARRARKRRA